MQAVRVTTRFDLKLWATAAVLIGFSVLSPNIARASLTAPGTSISNTATATYQDGNGTTYNTNSNTVISVVQNAPSLTDVAPVAQTVAPGQVVTDTYTLTNTGNAAGTFNLSVAGVTGGSDSSSSSPGSPYAYNLTIGGTTTQYTTLAALNTQLGLSPAATAASFQIGIIYSLTTSAATPGTIITTLTGTITQAGSAGPPAYQAVTSAAQTANITDSVVTDARMDLQKSSVQNGVNGNITYTVVANDGGNFPAKDLQVAQSLLGSATKGVLITDKVPQYPVNTPLAIQGAVNVTTSTANGFPTTANTPVVYYTTSATGTSGWTVAPAGVPGAGATYIGVFLSGGNVGGSFGAGYELKPNAGSSAGSVPSPAVTITYIIAPPTGAGSGDSGSVKNLADSVIGDNQPTEHILGPGIPAGTADGSTTTPVTTAGQGINNIIPLNAPSGASNQTSDQALTAQGVLNGPYGAPGATGSYDGIIAVSVNDDFTAVSFVPASFLSINSGTVPGTPNGNNTAMAVSGINVANSVQNSGNLSTTYTLLATAPAGWTVALWTYVSGSPGALLTGSVSGATSTGTVTIGSQVTFNYFAVYAAPSGVKTFVRYDATIVGTSTTNGTITNTTHNEIYSGFIPMTKTVTVTASGCPAGGSPGPPAGGVCPGGTLTYAIDYRNIVVGAGSGTEPASAVAAVTTLAGTFIITDDGTGANANTPLNNWATFSNGLTGAATDTTAGTVFTYSPTPGTAPGSTKFTAKVGGASFVLAPGAQGTVTYSVVVN